MHQVKKTNIFTKTKKKKPTKEKNASLLFAKPVIKVCENQSSKRLSLTYICVSQENLLYISNIS